jgi:UDP-N-acetylmuramate--alanine ligase
VAVITSIDHEHLDHYGSYEELTSAFVAFANKVPFYGAAILAIDDPEVRKILPRVQRKFRTYGVSPDADMTASEIECDRRGSRFRVAYQGNDLGLFEVKGFGRHNVGNAMAAILVGLEVDLSIEKIRAGLRSFNGVDRRFQERGQQAGVTVIDDYGHHPTEIAATLAAAKTCGFGKIHVLFQPHRYTRSHLLADEFSRCFKDCDNLYVLDIYGAGETPIKGVNGSALAKKIKAAGHPSVKYVASMAAAVEKAAAAAEVGDVIITLGAGNVSQAGEKLLERLAARQESLRQESLTAAS